MGFVQVYDKLWVWMGKSRTGSTVRFGFCVYTDRQTLRLPPFLLHLFPQCCYNFAYIIPRTRFSVHLFHTGLYSDTVSIRTTECRWYENDIWVTRLARGNRSSPWKTRLSATLFTINVEKVAHGQVSLRISLHTVQNVSQKLGFSPLPK
jgi:hypothetical protein